MEQLPGYEESDLQKYCVKLYKSPYGLEQAGFKWYKIICCMLADLGFKKWEADPAIFYIHTSKNILILAIHVNDCTMRGSSNGLIQSYKLKIKLKYDLTDLGPIHWLLGIKITRDCENRTISLSQSSYIDSLVRRFNFTDLKPYSTPMTQIFDIQRTSACRQQNKPQKCATSLTAKQLARSFTLLSPHDQILCF